jgi:hypothetical protein
MYTLGWMLLLWSANAMAINQKTVIASTEITTLLALVNGAAALNVPRGPICVYSAIKAFTFYMGVNKRFIFGSRIDRPWHYKNETSPLSFFLAEGETRRWRVKSAALDNIHHQSLSATACYIMVRPPKINESIPQRSGKHKSFETYHQ